jgi:hypothetical protein
MSEGSKNRIKSAKRKWAVTCPAIIGLLVIVGIACLVISIIVLDRIVTVLPTPQPKPILEIGRTYWIGAFIPPPGIPSGLVISNIYVYNKPGNSLTDPSVTIVAVLPDSTEVTLIGLQDEWCFIEGLYSLFEDYQKNVEGWIDCDRLLDYKPTPYPTPNLTPERP